MTGTYRLNWDTAEQRLEIACRGVWDVPVMRQFDQEFRATLTTLPRSGWTLLADLRGTGGWAPDLHSVVADLMTISRDQGMTQGAVVVSKTVGPPQKRHAYRTAFVQSVEEARALLDSPGRWASRP